MGKLAWIALPLALASPALGQPAAPPAGAAAAKAARLVEMTGVEVLLDTMFKDLAPMLGSQMATALENNPESRAYVTGLTAQLPGGRERLAQLFSEEFLTEIRKAYPDVKAELAVLYTDRFTEAELDELLRFYASGPGAKLLRLQPEIQEEMRTVGQRLGFRAGQTAAPRALDRAESEAGRR